MRRFFKPYLLLIAVLGLSLCGGGIGVPNLLSPIGGKSVSLPVSLIWSSVENAESYVVEVDTTTDFSSPVISTEVNDTTYSVASLDTFKYYWHVAAVDENGDTSDFSDVDSFVVTGTSYPKNLITTIQLPCNNPMTIDITPDGSELWVGYWGQTDTTVTVISTATYEITHQIPTTNPGNDIGELRISADGNYAYYCGVWNMDSSGIIELSATSYSQTRMMGYPYGSPPTTIMGPDGPGIALTQANDYIYASHMATVDDGYIAKFDLATGSPVDSVHMSWIADIDLNHSETKLYAVGEEDSLYELDPTTMTVTRQLGVGYAPHRLVITSDDQYAFVTGDYIYVVDLVNFSVVAQFDPDISPEGLELTPDEHYLYICDGGSNFIDIYDVSDPTNPQLMEKLEFPNAGSFSELIFNADGSRAYVVENSGYIYVLGK